MRGIKEIAGLGMWMNNGLSPWMESVLSNTRSLSKEKEQLLAALKRENEAEEKNIPNREFPPYPNQEATNH